MFAPTIEKCETIAKFLKIPVKNGTFVHSKCKNRTQIIKDFKNGKYDYLVTTAVLERGVTFKDLQVIIYDADTHITRKSYNEVVTNRELLNEQLLNF